MFAPTNTPIPSNAMKTRKEQESEALARSERYRDLAGLFRYPSNAAHEAEYARVFSHSVRGDAPLYEVEYGNSAIFQESHKLGDLAGFYRAFGLQLSKEHSERADHITVELEFLCFLCFKEAYACSRGEMDRAEACREAQRTFLKEHLGRWAFAFAKRTAKSAGRGFYSDAAISLEAFLTRECQGLGVTAGASDLDLRPVEDADKDPCISCSLPLQVDVPR